MTFKCKIKIEVSFVSDNSAACLCLCFYCMESTAIDFVV